MRAVRAWHDGGGKTCRQSRETFAALSDCMVDRGFDHINYRPLHGRAKRRAGRPFVATQGDRQACLRRFSKAESDDDERFQATIRCRFISSDESVARALFLRQYWLAGAVGLGGAIHRGLFDEGENRHSRVIEPRQTNKNRSLKGVAMATLKNSLSGESCLLRARHVFGRDRTRCDTIVGDPYVSRMHAHIRWTGGRWELLDHSSNGTLVSGTLVRDGERVALQKGDLI